MRTGEASSPGAGKHGEINGIFCIREKFFYQLQSTMRLKIGGILYFTLKNEMTPNHGSSIHDKINLEIIPMLIDLKNNQGEIKISVAKLEGRFEQHVDEGE